MWNKTYRNSSWFPGLFKYWWTYWCFVFGFAKAFDKVPHVRFCDKLLHYETNGTLLQWIKDFLTSRSQKVQKVQIQWIMPCFVRGASEYCTGSFAVSPIYQMISNVNFDYMLVTVYSICLSSDWQRSNSIDCLN